MPSTSYIDAAFGVGFLQDRTNNAGVDVTDVTGAELRSVASLFSPGVFQADAFVVAPGAGLSVDVGTDLEDLAVVPGTDPGQGNYIFRQGGTPPQNVTLQAAHVSDDRIDQIYLVAQDVAYDGGTLTLGRIARRTGDAAASPVAPGPDAGWSAYLLLATILVENGATSIPGANITDERASVEALVAAGNLAGAAIAGFVEHGGATQTGLFSVDSTTTYKDGASVTFTKPAAWNTYRLMAWGWGQFQIVTGAHRGEVRISIAGNGGPAFESGTSFASSFQSESARHERTGLTGNAVVTFQYRGKTGININNRGSVVNFIAFRTS